MTNVFISSESQLANTIKPGSECLGIVLAGGKSSRMGEDKSHLKRGKESMLSFSKTMLKNAGLQDIVISGTQHQHINGVADTVQDAGPLGGIYSVIKQYQPQSILVLPVDLPLITPELLTELKRTGELTQQACCYQDAYLPLYLPINAYTELFLSQEFKGFNGKGPSIRALLSAVPHKLLNAQNKQALFNTNTPEQWQQAKLKFSSSRNTHVSK